ncbi:hypothetical protein LRD69_02170 [Streptomyces sp. JH14]|uniref:hypothetical protein n=1 Tax=Streptomyces sp. JH14 TaxID=2793630 RepID=UPI0023F7AF55|nr:hypothetical protein [Streptomyces sp. JH14]MDF6040986.1 hypothetical protein [Streptomyces sp. JH14]
MYVTDGGGEIFTARKLVHGGARIAELMVGVGLRWRPDRIDLVEVGDGPALLHRRAGRVFSVDTVEIKDRPNSAYRRVLNPEKTALV